VRKKVIRKLKKKGENTIDQSVEEEKANEKVDKKCANCGKGEKQLGFSLKRCAACKVYYCSRDCQAADWKKNHKNTCAGRKK